MAIQSSELLGYLSAARSKPTVWDGDGGKSPSILTEVGKFRAHRVGWRRFIANTSLRFLDVPSPLRGMATNENGGRHPKHGRTCPKPTVWDGDYCSLSTTTDLYGF